jgi:hypothetical protein
MKRELKAVLNSVVKKLTIALKKNNQLKCSIVQHLIKIRNIIELKIFKKQYLNKNKYKCKNKKKF